MAISPRNYTVQARINDVYKLKIKKVAAKRHISESEVLRLALKNFLHNVTAK